MPSPSKKKDVLAAQLASDTTLVLDILKARWFELAAQENYPHTPKVTSELDRLEAEIRKLS